MNTLAQVQPDGFGLWFANAFYLVGLVAAVVVIVKQLRKPVAGLTRIEGQPVTIRGEVAYATVNDHEKLEERVTRIEGSIKELIGMFSSEITNMRSEIKKDISDLRLEVKDDTISLHERINELWKPPAK